jgi:hypothetical protein
MAGYTRQSIASIINGEDITAPPLTAEFNQLADAFNGSTGHSHDGTTGNAPKIDLTTSVTGFLPAVHGGIGGKNNFAATTNPLATDDAVAGYAPGSMWENINTGRVFICVGNTSNAAVWRELVQIISSNKIEPIAHDTIDLGTPSVRFQDLYLSGGISASGNAAIGGTLAVSGATTLNSTLQVVGTTLLNGNVTLGDADTDNITFSGEVISAITPSTTNAYDLGTSTKEWRDLYLDGTAHVDTLDVDENAGIIGNLEVTGNTTLTGTLGVTGDATVANLSATGTTTITSVDLNSGAIDGAVIGSASPAAGTFTTLNANTSLTAATADINGGTLDGVTIGGTTSAPATVTSLTATGTSTLSTVDINAGAIDGTTIGATSHTTGKFTTLQSTGAATLATVNIDGGTIDGTAIGGSATSSGAFTTVSASGGFTGDLTGDVTGNVTGNVTGAITGNVTGNLTGNVTSSGSSSFNNVTIDGTLNMNAGTTATITNLTSPTNTNDAATKGYVDTQVANLVDSAPGTLDTLNELAAALDDDPNFSTTITNSIATKLPLAGGTMTGAIAMGTNKITGAGDPTAAQDAATKNYVDNQDALQVSKSGDSMSGNLAMGSNNITGLATPTANDHATNKSYVDGVLGSATAASASAAAAATSETNAATSETNAANSATAAASSATSAAASLDSFDDRYLGAKATAPTVDNDGDALIIGALYFDTTTDTMKVYGSSGWVNAGSSVNGTSDRQTYTATAGQTVFAATYDAGYVDVYLNGVKLLAGTDFTAVNGTSIVLASGAANNDIVDIVAYGTFVLADHLTETQSDAKYVEVAGDTMTGDLNITGTLTSDGLTVDGDVGIGTSSPAYALDIDGSARLNPTSNPVLRFSENGTLRSLITGSSTIGLSIETQSTLPFIVQTNGTERMRIDSSGNVGIGTTSPSYQLDVQGAGNSRIRVKNTSVTGEAQFHHDGNGDLYIKNSVSGRNQIFFNDGAERMRIDSSGNVGIGTTSPKSKLTLSTGDKIFVPTGEALNFGHTDGSTNTERMRIDSSGSLLLGKTTLDYEGTAGSILRNDGLIHGTRSDGNVADFNRLSSDGEIVRLSKDGTTVGSIGVDSGDNITFGATSGGGSGLFMFGAGGTDPFILPMKEGALSDNTVTLGDNSRRFKDLYLSGGVYLGGTGSANYLDDYEEGTFTPVPSMTGGNLVYNLSGTAGSFGRYTKVGNLVTCWFDLYFNVTSGGTGQARLGGFPFSTSMSTTNGGYSAVNIRASTGLNAVSDVHGYYWANNIYFEQYNGYSQTTIGYRTANNIRVTGEVAFYIS